MLNDILKTAMTFTFSEWNLQKKLYTKYILLEKILE